mmetsp:Transcript_8813/g.13566  ORF Transcript_8813/g.13566 Transcript_8813/m.13566 type:complete len:290 (-) Transcript_8813:272-1141(-)
MSFNLDTLSSIVAFLGGSTLTGWIGLGDRTVVFSAGASGVTLGVTSPAFTSTCNFFALAFSSASRFASSCAAAAAFCVASISSKSSSLFKVPFAGFIDNLFTLSLLEDGIGFFFNKLLPKDEEVGFRSIPPAGTASFEAPGMAEASFEEGFNTPTADPDLASASFFLANSCSSFFAEMAKFSKRDPSLTFISSSATISPRFTASASTSFLSSALYATAALLLYFFSAFDPCSSVKPCFRKNSRALPFPPRRIASTCRWVHSSRSTERTNVKWTPIDLCCAEQSRQRRTP